ncbi:MAG: AI-2E family transporter [Myxococcales bacterium]
MDVSPSTSHRILVGLALISIALTVWIIRPFWAALFLAAVLAGALRRPMGWLSAHLRGKRSPAALLLTLAVLFTIAVPVAGLGAVVIAELLQGIEWLRGVFASQGVEGLIQRLPDGLEKAARNLASSIPDAQAYLQRFASASGQAAAAVGGAVAATTHLLLQGAMMLIALYFFLTDGDRLVAWLDANAPLRHGQLVSLIDEFRRTATSVLWASVGTAAIQTAVAAVGYLIARAPVPIFLVLLTFVVALIPAVGGGLVVVSAGIVQLVSGHVISGVFLIVWGVFAVGLVDNFTRPYLLKGGMALHGGIVFFALLGGVAAFGGIGLIVGPLIVTFLMSVTRLYRRDLERQEARAT